MPASSMSRWVTRRNAGSCPALTRTPAGLLSEQQGLVYPERRGRVSFVEPSAVKAPLRDRLSEQARELKRRRR